MSLTLILSLSPIPSLNLADPGEDSHDILPLTRDKPWDVTSTLRSISETMGLLLSLYSHPDSLALKQCSRSLSQADDRETLASAQCKSLLRFGPGARLSILTAKKFPRRVNASPDASGLGKGQADLGQMALTGHSCFPGPWPHRTGSILGEHPICSYLGWRKHLSLGPLPNVSQS